MLTVTRSADARRVETPNATMTTLASPGVGGAAHALWRVEMAPGQAGPPHRSDVEQVLTVTAGRVRLSVDGEVRELLPGDTAVVPAGALRRVEAPEGLQLLISAAPTANAVLPDGTDRGVLPWAV